MSIEDLALEFPLKHDGLAVLNFSYNDFKVNHNDDKQYIEDMLLSYGERLKGTETKTIVLNFTELGQYSSAVSGIIVTAKKFCNDENYNLVCLAKIGNGWERMHEMLNLDQIAKVYYRLEDIPV